MCALGFVIYAQLYICSKATMIFVVFREKYKKFSYLDMYLKFTILYFCNLLQYAEICNVYYQLYSHKTYNHR